MSESGGHPIRPDMVGDVAHQRRVRRLRRHLDLPPPPLGRHRPADRPDSARMGEAGLPEVRRVVRGLGRAFLYLSIYRSIG